MRHGVAPYGTFGYVPRRQAEALNLFPQVSFRPKPFFWLKPTQKVPSYEKGPPFFHDFGPYTVAIWAAGTKKILAKKK